MDETCHRGGCKEPALGGAAVRLDHVELGHPGHLGCLIVNEVPNFSLCLILLI